jgi:glycosyltransferase involved in cell wall biosynthesis
VIGGAAPRSIATIPDAVSPRKGQAMASSNRPRLPAGALLVGHPYAVLGRAEDIRTAASALEAAGVPFALHNLHGDYGRHWGGLHKQFPLMHRIDQEASFRVNIFVLNANEMETAWYYQREQFSEDRYNIGYWAWELSQFPDAWVPALAGLDEVWAPSRFIQQSIVEKADCPVVWMPLAVELGEIAANDRRGFGLPEDRFLFLFFFDFRSFVGRKNPQAAIRAFGDAFSRADDTVGLVIKTNGMEECPDAYHEFRKTLDRSDPRIVWIDRVMDDREIRGLVSQCDCFVSLHRSEGFGRGLAEAMYLGKPVIATGYSGNLDFMNEGNSFLVDYLLVPVGENEYPHGTGQVWAEPDIEMAAAYMKALVADPALARGVGASGAAYIRRFHSYNRIGARYRRRLEKLGLIVPSLDQARGT